MINRSKHAPLTALLGRCLAALALMVFLGTPSGARADEADAKSLLKAMPDYMHDGRIQCVMNF
jgi:hypothetical protein